MLREKFAFVVRTSLLVLAAAGAAIAITAALFAWPMWTSAVAGIVLVVSSAARAYYTIVLQLSRIERRLGTIDRGRSDLQ